MHGLTTFTYTLFQVSCAHKQEAHGQRKVGMAKKMQYCDVRGLHQMILSILKQVLFASIDGVIVLKSHSDAKNSKTNQLHHPLPRTCMWGNEISNQSLLLLLLMQHQPPCCLKSLWNSEITTGMSYMSNKMCPSTISWHYGCYTLNVQQSWVGNEHYSRHELLRKRNQSWGYFLRF